MEIGVSTASFFGKKYTEEAYDELNRLGIPVCETFLSTFMEYEKDFVDLLLEKKGDLQVYSVHALTSQFEPQLYNLSDRTRADALKIFDKVIEAGTRLGAKVFTFHGAVALKKTSYCDMERVGKITENLVNRAKEKGIDLAYENVHWSYYNYPEFIEKLSNYAPSVKTCLDIKQAMQSGIDYRDYLKFMKGKLLNVHLCDYDASGKLSVCGKGDFDFYELFCRLIDIGYDGAAIMELYSKDYGDFDEIKAGYEYLLNIYEKAKRVR